MTFGGVLAGYTATLDASGSFCLSAQLGNIEGYASASVVDPTGQTLTMVIDVLKAMDGAFPGFPKFGDPKPLKGEPSFVGIAVALKGYVASADVFVPATAIATGRKLFAEVLKKNE